MILSEGSEIRGAIRVRASAVNRGHTHSRENRNLRLLMSLFFLNPVTPEYRFGCSFDPLLLSRTIPFPRFLFPET